MSQWPNKIILSLVCCGSVAVWLMTDWRLMKCQTLSSSANLHKLRRIQNSLARIVTGKHRHEHIKPALTRLHTGCPSNTVSTSNPQSSPSMFLPHNRNRTSPMPVWQKLVDVCDWLTYGHVLYCGPGISFSQTILGDQRLQTGLFTLICYY